MSARGWSNVLLLISTLLVQNSRAQEKPADLTPMGKAILKDKIVIDGRPLSDRPGPTKPLTFPLATCMFPGGLCGAVRRDGTIAVYPRYDWVGIFSDNRAAVRFGGLYGFVDDEGNEIVKPQYRIVDDYKFGFAQVDVDGKSGLIDRDGKMVMEPKYGYISAISPDRFQIVEERHLGGMVGGEDFSDASVAYSPLSVTISSSINLRSKTDIIDISGRRAEPFEAPRTDASRLVELKFGKIGSSVEDQVRAWANQAGGAGAIDKTGSWALRTNYQQLHPVYDHARKPEVALGWDFKSGDRWGFLGRDGHIVIEADFDQMIQHCADGQMVAYKNKESFAFRTNGSPIQPKEGRLIDVACNAVAPLAIKVGEKIGFVDAETNPLTPVQFDAVTGVVPGIKNVKIDGKWGRIGADGGWLLEPKFDYLSDGADLFVASVDGRRGFMRSDGTWLIEPKFDAARFRGDGTAFVTVSGATGVLRLADQSWAVSPRPGVMRDINDAIVSQTDRERIILSRTGETWIDIGAPRIGLNLDFGLLTFLKEDKWGLVDTAGQIVVEPQFEEPVYFMPKQRGIAWAKRDSNWCAIDRRGHSLLGIPCAATDPTGLSSTRFECKVER
jgi:hypothetical protein